MGIIELSGVMVIFIIWMGFGLLVYISVKLIE